MTARVPYYERTLGSFADEIITRQRQLKDGNWHAVLDCGFRSYVSDPDFSIHGYAATRADAARKCAAAIRNDARGIGKYAPHSLLRDGYDLKFRLMPHWDRKERLAAAGEDPDEVYRAAVDATRRDPWGLKGGYLSWIDATRSMEFAYRLALAETNQSARNAGLDAASASALAMQLMQETWGAMKVPGVSPTEGIWDAARQRFDSDLTRLILTGNEPNSDDTEVRSSKGHSAGPEL